MRQGRIDLSVLLCVTPHQGKVVFLHPMVCKLVGEVCGAPFVRREHHDPGRHPVKPMHRENRYTELFGKQIEQDRTLPVPGVGMREDSGGFVYDYVTVPAVEERYLLRPFHTRAYQCPTGRRNALLDSDSTPYEYRSVTIRQFFMVVELRTKVISVSTYLLATLYALAIGIPVEPWLAVVLLFAVLCVDMGTTAFNSFYDYVRGVDNPLFTVEPDKVLVYAGVAPGHALLVSAALYFLAAVFGVIIAISVGWWVVFVGALCMLIGFLYNGGPLPISRTPAGELAAGGFLGTVLFLVIVVAHGGQANGQAVLASLPSSLLIASVLTVNNTCDMVGDTAAGRRTLSVVIGRRGGAVVIYALGMGAFLIPVLAGVLDLLVRLPLLPPVEPVGLLPLGLALTGALSIYRRMAHRGYSHATKPASMGSIIAVVVLFTVGYGLAMML